MITLDYTTSATQLVGDINSNLQEMSSATEVDVSMSATALVGALNTAFNDVTGAVELTTDMDAPDFVAALNTNFGLADNPTVKAMYEAELTETVTKANTLDDENGLVFLNVTDIHYEADRTDVAVDAYVFDDTVVNMKALTEQVGVDSVLCLGDMIDGNTDLDVSRTQAEHVMDNFDSIGKPLLIALGNHDNNRNGNGSSYETFDASELQTLFMSHLDDTVTFPSPNPFYNTAYYKDYSAYSLRLIVFYGQNYTYGQTYEFSEATRQFLLSSLQSLPTGYKAIVITHVPPITAWNYNSTVRSGGESGSTTAGGETITGGIKGIIQQYSDDVIAFFYGHNHEDNVWCDPFVGISTCCNKSANANGTPTRWPEDGVMPIRSASDYTDDLWDVVLIKPTAKSIDMVRFGAGFDRRVHYEAVECAAGSSVTLTNTYADGGTWTTRTSDASKASVAGGVVTVDAGAASGTFIQIVYTNVTINANKQVTGGDYKEYWTIKVV